MPEAGAGEGQCTATRLRHHLNEGDDPPELGPPSVTGGTKRSHNSGRSGEGVRVPVGVLRSGGGSRVADN